MASHKSKDYKISAVEYYFLVKIIIYYRKYRNK